MGDVEARVGDASVAGAMEVLDRALDDARAWVPGAEDKFRQALSSFAQRGNALALAYGWDRLGAYLLDRGRPGPALLAYEAARRWGERAQDADSVDRALYGQCYALNEVGSPKAQLACLAILERRGALGVLPTTEQALAEQQLTARQLEAVRRFLSREDKLLRALRRAVAKVGRKHPRFEQRFLAGEARFDTPEELFGFLRKSKRDVRYRNVGALRAYRLYRRRWLKRLLLPGLPPLLVGGALALGLIGPSWLVVVIAAPALALYAIAWWASVRSIRGWVKAARMELEMFGLVDQMGRSESTHDEAYEILQRFAESRAPFALFLRSFEPEAAEFVTPKGVVQERPSKSKRIQQALLEGISPGAVAAGYVEPEHELVSFIGARLSPVEAYLAERVSPSVPIVTVSNPAAIATALQGGLPRLEVGNEDWETAVRVLISAARFIVIEIDVIAPGVVRELELVQNRQRVEETVVVLPSTASAEQIRFARELLSVGFSAPVGPGSPVPSGSEEVFGRFSRVVSEETLVRSDPQTAAAFEGLLPSTASAPGAR